jgi:hypothetical protein
MPKGLLFPLPPSSRPLKALVRSAKPLSFHHLLENYTPSSSHEKIPIVQNEHENKTKQWKPSENGDCGVWKSELV